MMTKSEYLRCPGCGQTERREVVDGTTHDYRCTGYVVGAGVLCDWKLGGYLPIPPPSEAEEMRALLVRVRDTIGCLGFIIYPARTVLDDVRVFLNRDAGEGER